MGINSLDFQFVSELVERHTANKVDKGKEYLVDTRLSRLSREEGMDGVGELVTRLRKGSDRKLLKRVLDAMMTTETLWFRDGIPWTVLEEEVLPAVIARNKQDRTLNLWCAATSTGQEPYTVAMILREKFPELLHWKVRFISTDINEQALARAREGLYGKLEVSRGLPEPMLRRYFEPCGDRWQVERRLRDSVEFRQLNLIDTWPNLPRMDIVFMRNVLIYFDVETKQTVLRKVRQILKKDGYFFLGGGETTLNLDPNFARVGTRGTAYYTLK